MNWLNMDRVAAVAVATSPKRAKSGHAVGAARAGVASAGPVAGRTSTSRRRMTPRHGSRDGCPASGSPR